AGLGDKLISLDKDSAAEEKNALRRAIGRNYDSDGIDFSGGELQKIALARALYKDAPFVILDEPTAALDPIAEAAVYENINALTKDKTAVFISHRLSSCRFCDEIAVFDHGCLVQSGSHDSLVSDEAGKYSRLWHAQAKYYDKNASC
ncbi:MAG: ATP-binding cassette domain-containing protein, partial [Acetatifactor sp.]|nr:ATP-binding cassette domain-containing protein [Acetatifactor sp.]